MTKITLELPDAEYKRLQKQAQCAVKQITTLICEWIAQVPKTDESVNIKQDPLYLFEGFDSAAPTDLSINVDKYLYGEKA